MTERKRYREFEGPGAEALVGELIRAADVEFERAEELSRDASAPFFARERTRRQARWQLAGAGVVALAVGALLLLPFLAPTGGQEHAPRESTPATSSLEGSTGWSQVVFQGLGTFEREAEKNIVVEELDGERRLYVEAGLLRAVVEPQPVSRPLIVVSPHFRVVVLGTRFDLLVEPERSSLELLQGRVRIESAHGMALLEAGESIDSEDPRLWKAPLPFVPAPRAQPEQVPAAARRLSKNPSALQAAAESGGKREEKAIRTQDCEALAEEEQVLSCLTRLAEEGRGLTAQSATYLLGLRMKRQPARSGEAIAHFDRLLKRFPKTIYGPEAALQIFELELARGREGAAIEAAADFERRFPSDPRSADLKLARARLLCKAPENARTETLRALLQELLVIAATNPEQRAEVEAIIKGCGR